MSDLRQEVDVKGFSVLHDLLNSEEIEGLLAALSAVNDTDGVRRRGGVYAIRNLLDVVPAINSLALSPKITGLVHSVLGAGAFPVRGTLFDKTADANWLVPWHQDLTICLQERINVAGYGPWTIKAGVHHVQPPANVLDAMLAVRIHFDDCNEHNGALRILPFTHRSGRLTNQQIESAQRNLSPAICSVGRGGAVLMKPLILHASSAADQPSHRRVIHIDFASCSLSQGLKWLTDYSDGRPK